MWEVIVDPEDKYSHMSIHQLGEMMGVLPMWVDYEDPRSIREQFNEKYQFGLFEMTGGTVDPETGVHSYPEDPDLWPIGKMTLRDEIVWFYPYAMVAIKQADGSMFVTRMD